MSEATYQDSCARVRERIIRKAVPQDIPGILDLGVEALERDPHEGLVISRRQMFDIARECVSSASNFAWVVEKEGVLVGAVLALSQPMSFYERNMATVVQFYCKEPGYGIKLLREFLSWARSRRAIKMIVVCLEHRADPRIGDMLVRLGLEKEMPVYMEIR